MKISKFLLFVFFICLSFNVFAGTNIPFLTDPPVTVHNETAYKIKATWHVDIPSQLKISKYEAVVEPKKSVTLKDGITYYATSNSKSNARVQKNRVEMVIDFFDKNGKEIKDEDKAATVRVFARHDIAKDHLLTLEVYIKNNNSVEFKEVEKK